MIFRSLPYLREVYDLLSAICISIYYFSSSRRVRFALKFVNSFLKFKMDNNCNFSNLSSEHYIAIVSYSVIFVFLGLLGNILVVAIFLSKELKKKSSSIYLALIGVTDSVVLVNIFIDLISSFYDRIYRCNSFLFFDELARFLSVWLGVASTVENFLIIVLSRKLFLGINCKSFCVVVVTICVGCFVKLPYLLFYDLSLDYKNEKFVCGTVKFKVSKYFKMNLLSV